MNANVCSARPLEQILRSFERYYNVRTEDVVSPFVAEAEFHVHSEQYFLVKAAHVANIDSNEYVFFADEESLDAETLSLLAEKAWQEGLSRVHPYSGHRNSDVTLIVVSNHIDEAAFKCAKKMRKYKSYKYSLCGWSNFRVMVYEASSARAVTNRHGADLQKLVDKADAAHQSVQASA